MTDAPKVTFIAEFEPRVRRRWWSAARRARRMAQEAIIGDGGPVAAEFIVSIHPPSRNNPHRGEALNYFVGHAMGVITAFVSTSC